MSEKRIYDEKGNFKGTIRDAPDYEGGGGGDEFWELLPGIIGWILIGTTAVAFFINTRGGFQMLAITIIYLLFVGKKWALGLLGLALYCLGTVLHIFS